MREVIFLSCEASAAQRAAMWARGKLRDAGLPARAAKGAAERLADAFRAAMLSIHGPGPAARGRGGDAAEVMLSLSDEDGDLSFELIADGDQPDAERLAGWEATERRVAGDGVTCLRMRAGI